MNNIIANLRRDRPLSWENRLEAADEIFRLREENARLREENDAWRMDGGSCAEEVKRLREESEKLRDGVRSTIQERDVLSGENWDLRKENARLREERDLLHAILTNVSLSMEAFDVNSAIREGGKDG